MQGQQQAEAVVLACKGHQIRLRSSIEYLKSILVAPSCMRMRLFYPMKEVYLFFPDCFSLSRSTCLGYCCAYPLPASRVPCLLFFKYTALAAIILCAANKIEGFKRILVVPSCLFKFSRIRRLEVVLVCATWLRIQGPPLAFFIEKKQSFWLKFLILLRSLKNFQFCFC